MDAPRTHRTTLVEVARLAGVDKAVVSRVANGDPTLKVKDSTRLRVESAIKQLGYVPNSAARQMRTARSDTYGLVIPDFSNPVVAAIITGAQSEAALHGRIITVVSEGLRIGDEPGFVRLLSQNRLDGLLIAGDRVTDAAYGALRSSEVPWKFCSCRSWECEKCVSKVVFGPACISSTLLLGVGDLQHGRAHRG